MCGKSLFPELGILHVIPCAIAKKGESMSVVYLETMRSYRKAQKRSGITMLEQA